jgi:hypothetical protein
MPVAPKLRYVSATSASISFGIEPETCECCKVGGVSVRALDHHALGKTIVGNKGSYCVGEVRGMIIVDLDKKSDAPSTRVVDTESHVRATRAPISGGIEPV